MLQMYVSCGLNQGNPNIKHCKIMPFDGYYYGITVLQNTVKSYGQNMLLISVDSVWVEPS